jgi:hypothetical protein
LLVKHNHVLPSYDRNIYPFVNALVFGKSVPEPVIAYREDACWLVNFAASAA